MRLQQIDLEMDAGRSRLAEIDRSLASDGGASAARAALDDAKAALAQARAAARALEAEVEAVALKAGDVENALYGGHVTHPKELQDLQDDLGSIKRRRAALEDRLLDAMVEAESGESAEKAALARMGEAEAALQQSHGALAAERSALEAALARMDGDREAAEAHVPTADRELYRALRQRKHGLAVARLEDGACTVCGVAPSSSRAQAARQGNEIIFCGNCERILYGE
jgi:predicted  nucleic acid-binding Zn-ribbon protein